MDIDRNFARLRTQHVSLALSTADMCCLLVLRACEAETAALLERDVLDRLTSVHDQFPEADNPRKRATHGLQRLREQRLVTLVSLGGLAREGEYSLSGLGRAIVDFFVDDAKLTKENLKVLTATLGSQLTRVRDDARAASTAAHWEERVVVPITVASRSLLEGIERRTRGLDEDQETVRADIARLLTERWLEAMEQTQGLLEATTARLEELRDVILEEQKGLEAILDDIEGLAQAAGADRAERAVGELVSDLARLSGWAVKRHDEWSAYYQAMLQTLRSLVRLDPDRALTQRLRDSLQSWPDRPWTLDVAPRLRIRVLRPVEHVVDRPLVEREHRAEEEVERVPAASAVPLEALVLRAVDGGATTLTEVLRQVLPDVPEEARFRDAGRVAEILATRTHVQTALERPWVHVTEGLTVEDWRVEGRR
ncbi:MAG: condensin subunit MukF [Pseudomonadota bacterium]|nr:condensin subunit MukF [Pseudomonadota bacterium]